MVSIVERYPVVGSDARVRLSPGSIRRVIKLNNAATTPPFQQVAARSNEFMQYYDALHRGSGVHAEEMVAEIEEATENIRQFIGASQQTGFLHGLNTLIDRLSCNAMALILLLFLHTSFTRLMGLAYWPARVVGLKKERP